jgi:hypothetical protein
MGDVRQHVSRTTGVDPDGAATARDWSVFVRVCAVPE